ncbi:MAG: ABC transporter permease [Deltaproteobacteria bacterium]|nr:ABC transporter permease [Deltaproteobacteria bacterium]MBP6833573.1 ABC transporter permease [Deltaproteobacteria bacterium]
MSTDPGSMERLEGPLEAAARTVLADARELQGVFLRALYWTARGRREPGEVARQCYEVGYRSAFFLSVTMGFIGMILVFQSGLQLLRVVPDLSQLGATFLELLVRDLGPTISAMMLATRVGAGIAAEIGSMVVTEQVDALRMCGVDPVDHLVVPRFIASMIMTVVLVMFSGLVSFAAGGATAWFVFDVQPLTYANFSLLDRGDLITGLAKCFAYGAAIPIVSGWCGLTTRGGSEGVGSATTSAVVNSSLAVIMLDLVISGVGFVVFV